MPSGPSEAVFEAGSVRQDHDIDATVERTTLSREVRCHRLVLATTDGLDTAGGNASADQHTRHGTGPGCNRVQGASLGIKREVSGRVRAGSPNPLKRVEDPSWVFSGRSGSAIHLFEPEGRELQFPSPWASL